MSAPSTFDTNRHSMPGWRYASRARYAIAGPRSEPPMPMLTTVVIRCPVAPSHSPLRTRSANALIRVEHRVHVGHDVRHRAVVAGRADARARRCPQCHVEHGALLGGVDRRAGEHRVAAGRHAGRVGHREQRGHHLVGDALLGVVDAQVADLDHVARGAIGVVGEQLAQVRRGRHPLQRGPLRRAGDVDAGDRFHVVDASHDVPAPILGREIERARSILLVEISCPGRAGLTASAPRTPTCR